MKTGIELITEERRRQIEVEGWTAEHDKQHVNGDLVKAAICYASPNLIYELTVSGNENLYAFSDPWPIFWDRHWDKRIRDNGGRLVPNKSLPPSERIRNLVKAGALIAAEIDRLHREEMP